MSSVDEDPYALIPELGDLISIVSTLHKTVVGYIIYRDEKLIRVRPYQVSDRAVDFPLDVETGLFTEGLGVSKLVIHKKAAFPHFSLQLTVTPGERLEFYSVEGASVADMGTVKRVIASTTEDAIELEDGRILNFGFIGPQPPIAVLRPIAAEEDETEPENNEAEEVEDVQETEEFFPDIDYSLLPAPLVEEIPTHERSYSDVIQRDDMHVSLLMDVSAKQQQNPRVIRNLYRKTDLMLALKNSVVVRDENESILPGERRSYEANTIRESLIRQPSNAPIARVVPVMAMKKVLYTDDATDIESRDDVEIRPDVYSLVSAQAASNLYYEGKSKTSGNPFITYMDLLLRQNLPSFVPSVDDSAIPKTSVDQDVLRSRIPPEPVSGFPIDLPAAEAEKKRGGEEESVNLTVDFLGTIEDRSARVLGASRLKNFKTGQYFQIAPADTGATVGHVVLSPSMGTYRSPIRSSVLLWDISASETSRQRSTTFYKMMMNHWESQKVLREETDDLDLLEEIKSALPPIQSIHNRSVVNVMDSLGLRNLEMTDPILEALSSALVEGRRSWDSAFEQLKKRAIVSLESEENAPVFPQVSSDSPLWSKAVLENEDIKQSLSQLQESEPELSNTTTIRAAHILNQANSTLRTLWYMTAAESEESALRAASEVYRSERRRLERATATKRSKNSELKAEPTINKCPHVRDLDSVLGVRDDGKRMMMLDKFLQKYQSGLKGNWIQCGSCDQNLICRHDLLLLHEYLHPGRGTALHKALLLEFSGPVFEGSYICKSCGQKISDLEYDNHIEFDDEGRPMVGRAVLEPTEEDANDMAVTMKEEGKEKDSLGYEGADLSMYFVVRSVLEQCGITLIAEREKEVYDRVIKSVKDYIEQRITPETHYNQKRQMALAAKKAMPMYKNYKSSLMIGVIGSAITLEILTSDVAIPFPAYGCKFQRGGFPLESSGTGTMTYVGCVLAGIGRNDAPWNEAVWSATSDLTKRQNAVMAQIQTTMNILLCIPDANGNVMPPLTDITATYKSLLDKKKDEIALQQFDETRGLASSMDRLPPQFRPASRIVIDKEKTAVQNAKNFEANVKQGDLTVVGPYVRDRQIATLQTAISSLHTNARSTGFISPGNPRSDSICCNQRLGAVAIQGLGISSLEQSLGEAQMAEIQALEHAARKVRTRDPALSSNGTHIMVPWSAPTTVSELSSSDSSMYYRLFMKNCFRGENMGLPHEFGEDYVCRQCEFQYPAELTYMVPADISEQDGKKFTEKLEKQLTDRMNISLQAFMAQGITIDTDSFHALEDAIHRKKLTYSVTPPMKSTILEEVAEMTSHIDTSIVLPSFETDWKKLEDILRAVQANPATRARSFNPFANRYEEMFAAVLRRLEELRSKRIKKAAVVQGEIESFRQFFLKITENITGGKAAKNIYQAFIVSGQQIANNYTNLKPNVNKWFPSISRTHKETLNAIWESRAEVVIDAIKEMNENVSEDVKMKITSSLQKITEWGGHWFSFWITGLRSIEVTESEVQLMLRLSLLHMMAALLFKESPLYKDTTETVLQPVMEFFAVWCMDTLKDMGKLSTKYELTAEQVKNALHVRAEDEKRAFIKKFDDKDRDERKVELIKKKLKIGDWAIGNTKNLFNYNPEFYEFERAQRAEMGIPEFANDITGLGQREDKYGLGMGGGPEEGYDHRAQHDEDV